jgi:hypothetical protein
MKTLRIAEIYLDEDGIFWGYYWGNHIDQGGKVFTQGNIGVSSIEFLLNIMKTNMKNNEDNFKKLLEKLQEQSNEDR